MTDIDGVCQRHAKGALAELISGYSGLLTKACCDSLRGHFSASVWKLIVPFVYIKYCAFSTATPVRLGRRPVESFAAAFPTLDDLLRENWFLSGLVKDFQVSRVRKLRSLFDSFEGYLPAKSKLSDISAPLGDLHSSFGVCRAQIGPDKLVIYKPRSVEGESRWQRFIQALEASGIQTDLYYSSVLFSGPDNGICSFVPVLEVHSPDALNRFYRRAGKLLFWLWLLGTRDVISENIIANGEFPVLIDCETVCHSHWFPGKSPFSVLDTGMLPVSRPTFFGADFVFGALSVNEPRRFTDYGSALSRSGEFVFDRFTFTKTSDSVPIFGGEPVTAVNFLHEILDGFNQAHSVAEGNADKIGDIVEEIFSSLDGVRVVFRPTAFYHALIQQMLLSNSTDTFNRIERQLLDSPVLESSKLYFNENVIAAEIAAIREASIPHFSGSSVIHEMKLNGSVPPEPNHKFHIKAKLSADVMRAQAETIRSALEFPRGQAV